MAKYHSGQKIVQGEINALRKRIDVLKSATPTYGVEQGSTYGQGLAALRDAYTRGEASLQPQFVKADGNSIVRPLIFEETIDAIVNAYESGHKELLIKLNDSCTGIAYKTRTSRFKVVPASQDLILLSEDFSLPFVSVDYDGQDGTELDKRKGKYDVPLTKSEVLKNPGWLTTVKDKSLLRAFRDIVFAECKTDTAMEYHVEGNQQEDQLMALCVFPVDCGSLAYVRNNLSNCIARFVRVSPK